MGATAEEAAQAVDAAFQVEHGDFDHTSRSAEQWYPHSRAIEDPGLGNDGAHPGVREFGSQFESQSNDWRSSHEEDATLDAEPGIFRGSYSDLLSASSFAENSFAHHDPETSLDLSQYDSHPDGDYFNFDDGQSLFEQESAVETLYNTSLSSNADLSTPGEANLDMWQHPYAPPSSSTGPSQSVDIGLSQPTSTTAAAAGSQLKPVAEDFAATLQPQTERARRGKRTRPLSPKTGQRALHNRRNQLVCVTCHKRKTAVSRSNFSCYSRADADSNASHSASAGMATTNPVLGATRRDCRVKDGNPPLPVMGPRTVNGSLGTRGRQRDEMQCDFSMLTFP